MKIFQLLFSAFMTGVVSAALLLLAACDPVAPPRADEGPSQAYQMGDGSDKTMDHNGVTSGNSDPARRE
jgi:hypothetical protein